MARRRKGKSRASTLAKKILSSDDIHIEEYHGRKSAWDSLKKREEKRFEGFIGKYVESLNNKHIRDRIKFIEKRLTQNRFNSIEDISGESLEFAMDPENAGSMRKGQKFYTKFQDTMIVAVQVGQKPIEEGAHFAAAHIDSPGIQAQIKKLRQNYNQATMPCGIYGGIDPKDYFNIPMSMFYHGVVRDNLGNDITLDFSVGESYDEPNFVFSEESLHLGEDEDQGVIDLQALLGTKPYSKNWDPGRTIMLNSLNELKRFSPNKRVRITERDLENADIWFLPAAVPSYVGLDQSVIGAYGQDNWACAFSLLHAFLETKKPEYTKIAIFYNGEERGDSGRGSFSGKYLNDIVIPALTNFRHETDPNMWRMMMKGWSMFLDATGPINPNKPEMHDPRDGSYFGSGMTIIPRGGGTGGENGYDAHPEHLYKIRRLFDDAKVDYQLASMGTVDNLVENASDIFHSDIYSHGIDLGIPLQGMHRPTELVCAIDLWNLTKGIQTVYGAESY